MAETTGRCKGCLQLWRLRQPREPGQPRLAPQPSPSTTVAAGLAPPACSARPLLGLPYATGAPAEAARPLLGLPHATG